MTTLTQDQFAAADAKLGEMLRADRKNPEVLAKREKWEAVCNLSERTGADRQKRLEAIAATAAELGLI